MLTITWPVHASVQEREEGASLRLGAKVSTADGRTRERGRMRARGRSGVEGRKENEGEGERWETCDNPQRQHT
eukprot:1052302-Pleurochrysis_carterae.AAC.1